MPDLYTQIEAQPREILEATANSLAVRAAEPAMREIFARYMGQVRLPAGARALEVGCGSGESTKHVMEQISPAELIGIDPAPAFIEMAEEAFQDDARVTFVKGTAAETHQPSETFDLVLAHTVFSHLADPEAALAEAFRILKPGGLIAIFDGDYATITVALFDGDPLQAAVDAVLRNMVHAPYVMRRLPWLAGRVGFDVEAVDAHGYVQTASPDYLISMLSRGAMLGARAGEMSDALVEGFQKEAASRVEAGSFYGSIMFMSLIGRKPGASIEP